MALRRLSSLSPLRVGVRWLSTLNPSHAPQHIVSITLVDKEGLRHVVKGVQGQVLNDVLAENDEMREEMMVVAPHGCGAWDVHVFVTKEIMKKLPPLDAKELDDLQDTADNISSNSRMASSITLSKDVDGAIFALGDVRPWLSPEMPSSVKRVDSFLVSAQLLDSYTQTFR